jgi:hypothetical protein
MCEKCGKDIDLSWSFCAACGQDNRAPERRRDPVPGHAHQFAYGLFCVECGVQGGLTVPLKRRLLYAGAVALFGQPFFWYGIYMMTVGHDFIDGAFRFAEGCVFLGIGLYLVFSKPDPMPK